MESTAPPLSHAAKGVTGHGSVNFCIGTPSPRRGSEVLASVRARINYTMAADASTAAMCTYLIEARKYGAPTPDLPVSRGGSAAPYEYLSLKQIPLGQFWNGLYGTRTCSSRVRIRIRVP